MRFWRYLAAWSVPAVLFAIQGYSMDAMRGHTWNAGDYLRWAMVQWYTLAVLAPGVFALARRFTVDTTAQWRYAPVYIAGSLVFSAGAVLIGATLGHLLEPGNPPFDDQLQQFIDKYVFIDFFIYWVLVVGWHAMRFFREKDRRADQLQALLAQSRLQVLRMQLQPHFLFNTLHVITTLIREEPEVAEDMLLRLSELLRVYLDEDRQEIALARELELLDLYLGIQRVRFKDRLDTRVDAAVSALGGAVPGLILQPLVENAIHHGIGRHAGSDTVEVFAHRDTDSLYLEVRNRNGVLEVTPEEAFTRGIGLSNTRLRLKELYGDLATVYIDAMSPQGVTCRLRLPFRALGAAAA